MKITLRILTIIIFVCLVLNLCVVFFKSSISPPTSSDKVVQLVVNLGLLEEKNVVSRRDSNKNVHGDHGGNERTRNLENQDSKLLAYSGVKVHEYQESKQDLNIDDPTGTSLVSQKNSFLQSKQNFEGRINVYYFEDTCTDYNFDHVFTWNVLFPHFPSEGGWMTHSEDKKLLVTGQARHMIGFVIPKETALYSFQMSARLGAEMILIEDNLFPKDKTYDEFLLRFGVYNSQVLKEDDPKFPEKLFTAESSPVKLEKDKFYMIDITHAFPVYGIFKLRWKREGGKSFEVIPPSQLYSLYAETTIDHQFPDIKYTSNRSVLNQALRDPRNDVNTPVLSTRPMSKECDYKPDYISDNILPGYGTWYIQIDKIYPRDALVGEHNKGAKKLDLFINTKTANKIARRYVMENLDRPYHLKKIVHIEENNEKQQGKRYFVEVDVQHDGEQQLRSTGWLFVNKTSNEVCRPNGFTWNRHEMIYLITPVKNQTRWLKYLIFTLNGIIERTSEKNFHLIVVDFNSKDCQVQDLLKKKATFKYTFIKQDGAFSKVIGLNKGVQAINEIDALLFVFDLQLQIPDFLFDYIRKHTFKQRTSYVPILLRLTCGEHPYYTELTKSSIWQEIGYGMISIFKSDWERIGGMDEKKFGEKWGGEDWDFVERVLVGKMEVLHHRIPGYYHSYHSTKGTWDGTKKF